ncbi:type II secretion system F family protein [Sinomonas mesophila]|uniref:type II secretion system F family protein n=1 Tax=Sinomonas mesophila TaxID=1531955 RepID=UPI0009854D55|nr:type II secretion system F family protein [Sinomonas mesophila]
MSILPLCVGIAAAIAAAALWLAAPSRGLRRGLGLGTGTRRGLARRHCEGASPDPVPPRLSRRLQASWPSGHEDASLLLELIGSMLQAGLPVARALEVVAPAAGASARPLARVAAALRLGVGWDSAWPQTEPRTVLGELKDALHFAAGTGAPSAELLFARARQLRRTRHRELERRAAALGVRLVVPLGVCSLPAFLCLGVIPVLLAMLPGG